MAPGLLKILIASMQLYLIMYSICSYVCILFAFISYFLKLAVYMLGYVPYITTGFTVGLYQCNLSTFEHIHHGQNCIPLVDTGCKFS